MPSSNLANIDVLIVQTRALQARIQSEADADEVQDAVRQVERAGSQKETVVAAVSRFEPTGEEKQTDPATEDQLAAITLELHAGNVLIAAGQAVGETRNVAVLDQALRQLENTRNAVAKSSVAERANFEAAMAEAPAQISPEQAPGEFRSRAETTLNGLMDDAADVVGKAFEKLKDLDPAKIAGALAQFAEETDSLKGTVVLIRQGIQKIQDAYNALIRLIGKEALKAAQDRVEKVWNDFKDGKFTRDGLGLIYGVKPILDEVTKILAMPVVDTQGLVKACGDLAPLEPKFKKHMALLSGFISGIAVAAVVLPFTPVAPQAPVLVAAAYLLVIGGVLVIGMEYAGAAWTLHWVRGVGRIVRGMEPATPK